MLVPVVRFPDECFDPLFSLKRKHDTKKNLNPLHVEVTLIAPEVKNPLGGINGEYLLLSLVPRQTHPKWVLKRKEITKTIFSTGKTLGLPGFENMRSHSHSEHQPLRNVV